MPVVFCCCFFFLNDSVNKHDIRRGILMVSCKTLPQGWSVLSIMERGGRRGRGRERWTFFEMMASNLFLPCSRAVAELNRRNLFWLIFNQVSMKPEPREPVRSERFLARSGLTLHPRSSTWGWSCRSSGRVLTWLTGSWQCLLGWAAGRPRHLFAKKENNSFLPTKADSDTFHWKNKI